MANNENFKDKIKSLFRITKEKTPAVSLQRPSTRDFVFTPDILKDIGPESPGNNRLKTIKELAEVVKTRKLEENAIEAVWCSIQDLVLPQAVSEKRHTALHFLECLLEGQLSSLGILRAHFFNVIQGLTLAENLPERITLFKILSENGRNLLEFEEEAGPFLLYWMPGIITGGKVIDFLPLLISVIKYNAAYLDEDLLSGLVKQTCIICNKSQSDEEIKMSLEMFDTVVRYSYLPSDSLQHFVGALCNLVNKPQHSGACWELMRKLLGTHLGHSSIYAMCIMLQERKEPVVLLRGAIFYIGMALWGGQKVPYLKHTPAAILPSFLHAVSAHSPIITHEIIMSVKRLVKKYGKDLTHSTWDIVLDILESILKQLEACQDLSFDPRDPEDLKDTLTTIEQLHEHGQFCGSLTRFFRIIELCAAKLPESSVILLISYHAQDIHPGKENWIGSLYTLLEKYFKNETRTKVRMKALDVLSFVLSINKHMYEEDLINCIVLPHLCHIEGDHDVNVRTLAVKILLDLAQTCTPPCFIEVIGVIEKILCRHLIGRALSPFPSSDNTEMVLVLDESHLVDVKITVSILVNLFKMKLYRHPPGICVKLYDLLISHLTVHYTEPKVYSSNTASVVRKTIIECLLNLRADVSYRLGFCERTLDSPLQYSPYVTCIQSDPESSPAHSPVSGSSPGPGVGQWVTLAHIDYTRTFSLYIQCLETEKDWDVLKTVLDNLPILLQNKTIILSASRNLVDKLCSKLCAMVNDRQLGYPEKLVGAPGKFTRSDFHTFVFPVLAAMVTYHNYLNRNRQKELMTVLEFGMVSKCAKMCVNALRLCTLEMQDVMMRLLPSVLLQLTKISATVSMAIPVLAFLSSIVRLPKLYANFVEDEYMSVFAIALPYTNPFKFSHYTVSLAHHVIAIWFIKCRLPLRKVFVQYIQKGLKSNVVQQFEDNARLALQNQNQDSSDRARSGSYSEAALRSRRRMQSGSAISRSDIQSPVDEKLSQFHMELRDTCTDMMARYTFGNFTPLPHRSHMAEFLLAGGQAMTWLLGNKLITITTSGGGTKVGNSGICEKCQAAYQSSEPRDHKSVAQSGRRRHKSAAALARSSSVIDDNRPSSQDDLTVLNRSSRDDMSLELDMPGQDVGVQTGSSLSEAAGLLETEPLESLILGLKGTDPKTSGLNVCNCWCTNWAEIYIRAPSGNLSWMMRIENEVGSYNVHDSQIPDISMLFASMGKKQPQRPKVTRQTRRIESGSIGEEEYESLYAQHFPDDMQPDNKPRPYGTTDIPVIRPDVLNPSESSDSMTGSLGFSVTMGTSDSSSEQDSHHVSQALLIPSADSAKNHDLSPVSLRRSNSSPSVLSGSSGTLSPRESISDIVQFGPLAKGDKSSKIDVKSDQGQGQSEGENKVASVKNDSKVTLKTKTSKVKEEMTDGMQISKSLQPESNFKAKIKAEESSAVILNTKTTTVSNDTDKSTAPMKEFSSMLTKQLSPSPASSEASSTQDEVGELPSNLRRNRGHTIGATSTRGFSVGSDTGSKGSLTSKDSSRVGISPSFVFLQLFHSGHIMVNEAPMLLPNNETTERAIKMLDHIYPHETHKIGILYVGPNQTSDEKGILSNLYGSDRYMRFIQTLGTLFRLKDCDPGRIYLGGLDTKGVDGEFTYGWQDESTQLIFHIATLMPNKDSDPNCTAKKLHIGNDYVTVVYNDSGEDYKIGVIKGQFNYVNIVIKPLDYESNAVTLQAKEVPFQDQITTDIAGILGHTDTKIISDTNLAVLVRQIAIHCNLASLVLQRQQSEPQDPFANNWLERLRRIRRIKTKILNQSSESSPQPNISASKGQTASKSIDDFTQFV